MKPPPNYDIISGLYAFLMRSIIFRPPKVNSYISDTLVGLNYKQNCDYFGVFFLDLNDLLQMNEIGVAEILQKLKLMTFRH